MSIARETQESRDAMRRNREQARAAAKTFVADLRTGAALPEPENIGPSHLAFWYAVSSELGRYGLLSQREGERAGDLEVSRRNSGHIYRLKQTIGVDYLQAERNRLQERLAEIETLLDEG